MPDGQADWRTFAECAKTKRARTAYADAIDKVGTAEELVYPTKEQKATCGRCLVQVECLDEALMNDSMEGIWGGTTDYQRRQLRRKRVRERCPRCDGTSIVPENGHELCLACGASWPAI